MTSPTAALVVVMTTMAQTAVEHAPLPADPPIGGPGWTVVVPAVLLVGSFLGTYLLYRRFAKEEGE